MRMKQVTAKKILDAALAEVGTVEDPAGSNRCKYNRWMWGKDVAGQAYPWCCAFISWLFRDCQELCKKTASCEELLRWFENRGQLVKNPQPGDICFMKFATNNRRTNHVGIVLEIRFDGALVLIEGNTSTESSDNGGKVMRRIRKAHVVALARPKYSGQQDLKDPKEIAEEVIAGKWGNGDERKKKLRNAGYDPKEIQMFVNEILLNTEL